MNIQVLERMVIVEVIIEKNMGRSWMRRNQKGHSG